MVEIAICCIAGSSFGVPVSCPVCSIGMLVGQFPAGDRGSRLLHRVSVRHARARLGTGGGAELGLPLCSLMLTAFCTCTVGL